jgi:hypothetical protein
MVFFFRSKHSLSSQISREMPKMHILISLTFAALIYTTHGYNVPLLFKSTTDPDIFMEKRPAPVGALNRIK